MFAITPCGEGFNMKFANGWSISVQFGPFNYCDNKSSTTMEAVPDANGFYESGTAEVAVFNPDDKMVRIHDCDSVLKYQTPDQVAALIAQCIAGTVVVYPEPVYD